MNRSIHKVNEAVAVGEVAPLAEIYEKAVTRLLGA